MTSPKEKMSRRTLMGLVGGSCAVIGAAGFFARRDEEGSHDAPPPGARPRPSSPRLPVGTLEEVSTEVLVVGGGMAGVFAAVKAHDSGAKVVLVDKGAVGKSGQTPFARGIFRFDEKKTGMSRDAYLAKTAEVSEGMNNPAYTALLLDRSGAVIDELDRWGFFDEACYANSLNRPLRERKIPIYERVTLTHLLKEDGRIAGAMGMVLDRNRCLVIRARSVILCTGASGFKPAGWQIGSLTSDGDAMAYRVGAEITGKEWNDGHSRTNYGLGSMSHVTSEADLQPMLGVEENVEVSRNGPMASMGGPPGGPGGPPGGPGGRPPHGPPMGGPPRHDRAGGHPGGPPPGGHEGGRPPGPPPHGGGAGPITMGGASAGMSIHKAEGLFPANDACASNVPGLYAAGDALGSMQNGATYTQRGSSLAGSGAQGALAGEKAAAFARVVGQVDVPTRAIETTRQEMYAPLLRERGYSPAWVTQTLQGAMIPNFILYVKSQARLEAALTYVEHLRDHHVPLLMATDLHELRQAHETTHMILNAEMKLRASLFRKETRGSHYREDYPDRDDENWRAWVKIHRAADGSMQLTKHPV